MDMLFDLALMAHLLSLLVAGATVVAIPLIAPRMAGASPETRGVLGGVAGRIGLYSRIAFGVLIVTGPLMVWLRFGGVAGMNIWFWGKMALIVVMAIGLAAGERFRRLAGPDSPRAADMARAASTVSRLALLGIVIAAVLAFN